MSHKSASPARGRTDEGGDGERTEESATGPVPEIIRRMATLGLSGFFMTESAIRRALGDTVPKEWVEFATEQSDRTRTEVIDRIAQEMGRQLADTDPVDLLSQFLSGHTIEIEAKLRITRRREEDDDDGSPRVRTRFEVEQG